MAGIMIKADGDVPAELDAHVGRAAPFYAQGQGLVLKLSDFFVGDGSVAYDIGCATGALTRQLAERHRDTMTQLYTDFKSEQGFSDTEIIAKARSLKGVLEPFSTQGNLDLMRRAGFVDAMTVFKYLSFEGFLAINQRFAAVCVCPRHPCRCD